MAFPSRSKLALFQRSVPTGHDDHDNDRFLHGENLQHSTFGCTACDRGTTREDRSETMHSSRQHNVSAGRRESSLLHRPHRQNAVPRPHPALESSAVEDCMTSLPSMKLTLTCPAIKMRHVSQLSWHDPYGTQVHLKAMGGSDSVASSGAGFRSTRKSVSMLVYPSPEAWEYANERQRKRALRSFA